MYFLILNIVDCSKFITNVILFRKRTLTTEIVNKVFKCKKIEPVLGYSGAPGTQYPGQHGFQYIPEADRVVDADNEIDLVTESLNMSDTRVVEMDIKVSCSWIAVQGQFVTIFCLFILTCKSAVQEF